jgi:hypothetical protein
MFRQLLQFKTFQVEYYRLTNNTQHSTLFSMFRTSLHTLIAHHMLMLHVLPTCASWDAWVPLFYS